MAQVVPAIYPAPELVSCIWQENPPAGAVALWWLGQASFVLRAAGVTIYIDPHLAVSASRLSPPPFAPAAATNADLVLLTHNHSDHADGVCIHHIRGNTVPSGEFISYLHAYHPEQSTQVMGQFGKYVYVR
jgi:L-ascorbate 6-phosphate lactonase